MPQTAIPLALAGLVSLCACLPLTDQANQRNALYPLVRGSDRTIPLSKMRPYIVRNDDDIKCTDEGFFAHPKNCSQFYRCIDIANTGRYSSVFFECAAGTVFSKDLQTCLPGVCIPQPPPQGPPLKDPMMPLKNPGQNATSGSTGDTLPPSPPPPPPPPPPTSSGTIGSTSVQIPIQALPMPAWFNSTPWWYDTPPAWFNQTPDWFKPSNTQIISEEILIEEDLLGPGIQAVGHQGNFSVDGIDSSFSKDNKTIKIHIPIKIVQQ